jgi:hypothetical protein
LTARLPGCSDSWPGAGDDPGSGNACAVRRAQLARRCAPRSRPPR